jgi:hypothetical protein
VSTLNVDKVDPSTGTALELGTSGDTITVPTGAGLTVTDEVKTNKISPATGTAFALGDSGDTFTVPSGATIVNSGTATGFGGTYSVHAFSSLFYATPVTVSAGSTSTNISGSNYLAFTPTSQDDIFVISVQTIAHPSSTGESGFGLGIQGSTATGFDGVQTSFYHQGIYATYTNTTADKYWVANINGYYLLASDHSELVNDTAYYFRVMGQAHAGEDIVFQNAIGSEVDDGMYAYGIHLKKT